MLRAEQWLVLGFATIGIYAVYRMTRASALPVLSNPNRGATPTPIAVPMGALPPLPGDVSKVPSATAGLDVVSGSTVKMVSASWYQGRVELVSPQGKAS